MPSWPTCPGVTRDRQYGYGRFGANAYVVIDTGGLIENPVGIEAQMRMQTERAVPRRTVWCSSWMRAPD